MLLQASDGYQRALYQPQALAPERLWLLPPLEQCLRLAQEAWQCRQQGRFPQCAQFLRQALAVYPPAQPMIETLRRDLEKQSDPARAELSLLAQQVKAQIEALIAQQRLDEARALLDELEGILPDDADLPRLFAQARPTAAIWH